MTNDPELSGQELLDFVENRMNMTSYYQPVIIAALVEAGGSLSKHELAKNLLLADTDTVARAEKTLMRWPKATLTRHQILNYDSRTRTFTLNARFTGDDERAAVLAACTERLATWSRQELPAMASARYAAIETSGGRCQACGVPGFVRPLEIDHIRPRSKARKGKVQDTTGHWIPVAAPHNLQVLCSKCNRGKRDSGAFDFRPSEERLVETIMVTLQLARAMGMDAAAIGERALEDFRDE